MKAADTEAPAKATVEAYDVGDSYAGDSYAGDSYAGWDLRVAREDRYKELPLSIQCGWVYLILEPARMIIYYGGHRWVVAISPEGEIRYESWLFSQDPS
jgi:hypothetical protein